MKTRAVAKEEPTNDQIAHLAYFLYEKRGRQPGHDFDDWLEAEALLRDTHPEERPADSGFGSNGRPEHEFAEAGTPAHGKRPLPYRDHPLARDKRGSASREEIRRLNTETFRQGNHRSTAA